MMSVDLGEYVATVRRYWRSLIVFVLLGMMAGAGFALIEAPKYEATAEAFVSTGSATSIQDLTQGSAFTEQVAASYADVAASSMVVNSVIEQLRLPYSQRELSERVRAVALVGTSVIQIKVDDTSSARAVQIADGITMRLGTAVGELSPTVSGQAAGVKISQIQAASGTVELVAPRPAIYIAIGSVGGLLLGVVVAVLRRIADNRIRDVGELTRLGLAPTLGSVPLDKEAVVHPLVVTRASWSHRAEAFRSLRAALQFLELGERVKAITITSSLPAEGKTTTASNLALALSEAGERVLLIDADMRRPSIARYFGIDGSVGLSDVLISRVSFTDAVQTLGGENLSVLPAGQIPPNPSELLQSDRFVLLLEQVGKQFDVLVLDTPPLLGVSDAGIVARRTSGAILMASAGSVSVPQLKASFAVLERLHAKALGVVLTMAPTTRSSAYLYEYEALAVESEGSVYKRDRHASGDQDVRTAESPVSPG